MVVTGYSDLALGFFHWPQIKKLEFLVIFKNPIAASCFVKTNMEFEDDLSSCKLRYQSHQALYYEHIYEIYAMWCLMNYILLLFYAKCHEKQNNQE